MVMLGVDGSSLQAHTAQVGWLGQEPDGAESAFLTLTV